MSEFAIAAKLYFTDKLSRVISHTASAAAAAKLRAEERAAQFNAYDIIVRSADARSALGQGALRAKLDKPMAEKLVAWIGGDGATGGETCRAQTGPAASATVQTNIGGSPGQCCSPQIPHPALVTLGRRSAKQAFCADPSSSVSRLLDLHDDDASGDNDLSRSVHHSGNRT